jgi:hypothetical protein
MRFLSARFQAPPVSFALLRHNKPRSQKGRRHHFLPDRRLPEVLAEHAGTVRVLHTLRPFAVAMAGAGEFDPFKD